MQIFTRMIGILMCLSLLSACKNTDDVKVTNPSLTYQKSLALIEEEDFTQATKNFDAIERDFPSSEFASKALMMRAYALYLKGDFVDSIFASEDFIKQYPKHSNIDYMYYLKALCNYDQIVDIGRDQKQTEEAIIVMDEFLTLFPQSKYYKDIEKKRLYAYNAIAGKEMSIGNTYLRKGYTLPALVRFHTVVRKFNNTIFIEEALHRLVEIYYSMGIVDQSLIYATILGYNYPNSSWYKASYDLLNEK